MNPFVWTAVGLAAGWIVSLMRGGNGVTMRLETLAVGVFGAFIGGEFLAASFGAPPHVFSGMALAFAVLGAIVMLVLLGVMRKAVGPLKQHRPRRR